MTSCFPITERMRIFRRVLRWRHLENLLPLFVDIFKKYFMLNFAMTICYFDNVLNKVSP